MACDNNSFITGPEARIIARDYVTIFEEICALQQAILEAINSCSGPSAYSVVVPSSVLADPLNPVEATGFATLPLNPIDRSITDANVLTSGTLYGSDIDANVVFDSPNVTHALLGAAHSDGDIITDVVILDGGIGYIGGELVTIESLGSMCISAVEEVGQV